MSADRGVPLGNGVKDEVNVPAASVGPLAGVKTSRDSDDEIETVLPSTATELMVSVAVTTEGVPPLPGSGLKRTSSAGSPYASVAVAVTVPPAPGETAVMVDVPSDVDAVTLAVVQKVPDPSVRPLDRPSVTPLDAERDTAWPADGTPAASVTRTVTEDDSPTRTAVGANVMVILRSVDPAKAGVAATMTIAGTDRAPALRAVRRDRLFARPSVSVLNSRSLTSAPSAPGRAGRLDDAPPTTPTSILCRSASPCPPALRFSPGAGATSPGPGGAVSPRADLLFPCPPAADRALGGTETASR